jgi:hypothetical protein
MEKTMSMTTATKQNRGGRPLGAYGARRRQQELFERLCRAYAAEFFSGAPNEIERGLIRQAVGLQITVERLQADDLAGKDVDRDQIIRLNSEHRRVVASLRRKGEQAKPAGPSIQDILAEMAEATDDEEAEAS